MQEQVIDCRTLYKTDSPQDAAGGTKPEDFVDADFRQVVLTETTSIEPPRYRVKVIQGWWDEAKKEPIWKREQLNASYDDQTSGDSAFENQVRRLVSEGYIYSFSPSPFGGSIRRLDLESL